MFQPLPLSIRPQNWYALRVSRQGFLHGPTAATRQMLHAATAAAAINTVQLTLSSERSIGVNDPLPLTSPRLYEPLQWPSGASIALTPRSEPLPVDIVALLEQRQTRREFNRDLTAGELGDFLWLACRSRSSRPGPFGFAQESRPYPSAGGMHPIHVLLARAGEEWMRYDPVQHALIEFSGSRAAAILAREASAMLVPLNRGVLIALAAEPGRTAAKYENADSLVLRDAGTVLGFMSVVAEALGLSFCPLGILGEPHVSAAVSGDPRVQGAGLAILGAA